MEDDWQWRIDRAAELTHGHGGPLMTTYGRLLAVQRACSERLRPSDGHLTGAIEEDTDALRSCALVACADAAAFVPPALAADAPADAAAIDALLRDGWRQASPPFYARLVLQPYAERLARLGRRPIGRALRLETCAACPFCGAPPQLAILRREGGADGGGRALLCAMCATTWPFRRVRCAHCGEEGERQLAYFETPEFDHVRIDACDTCRRYLKTIDLGRLGRAVPQVDEVAAASLDLWAVEHGFAKIERNLIGL